MKTIEDQLWEKACEKLFISTDDFLKSIDGWKIETREIDGAPAIVTLTKGPEFHFMSLETGKPFTRKFVRSCIQPIIDKYGYATTKTPKEELRQQRFNRCVGFKVVGEDEYDVHFRIENLYHG